MSIETLRGNFTEMQALQIRQQERAQGHHVNIRRLHSRLLEIEIIHQDKNRPLTPGLCVVQGDTIKSQPVIKAALIRR